MFVAQPEHAIAAARAAIPSDPWRLGAVNVDHHAHRLGADRARGCGRPARASTTAWTAAHVDEDWNMSLWGRDELALERRATRFAEMQAAGDGAGRSSGYGFRNVNERFTLAAYTVTRRSTARNASVDSIHLPNAITLPTAFGAPGTPLQVGQVVQALVLELIESNVFRLQLPQAIVDVRSDVPLSRRQHGHARGQGRGRECAAGDLCRRRAAGGARAAGAADGASGGTDARRQAPDRRSGHHRARAGAAGQGAGGSGRSAASCAMRRRSVLRARRCRSRSSRRRSSRPSARSARRCASPPRSRAASRRCSPMSSRSRKRRAERCAGAGARCRPAGCWRCACRSMKT